MTETSLRECAKECCDRINKTLSIPINSSVTELQKNNIKIYLKSLITAGAIIQQKALFSYRDTRTPLFEDFDRLKSQCLRAKFSPILASSKN